MAVRQPLLSLSGSELKAMVQASLSWLKAHQQSVNALNVFPVPDGDTGTNMLLTMQAAWVEVDKIAGPSIHRVAHAVAHGALMGARGNSGVILSQLWRGFARGLDAKTTMNAAEFAAAMREACTTAYKGVIKPVEGTILTVSRAVADAAETTASTTQDLMFIFDRVLAAGKEAVARTPMQLDILRQAGVVDAGGQGLVVILEGMLRYLLNEPVDIAPVPVTQTFASGTRLEGIEAGQDYELVFDLKPRTGLDFGAMYTDLETLGTSIQVGGGEDELKIHIHVPTNNYYKTQEYAFTLGTITKIAVENLQDQMAEIQASAGKARGVYANLKAEDIATIAVASGDGLARVFESLGTSVIITGGQTMNPSTEDFVKAMELLPCRRAILIPNNGNVVMAARQAAELSGAARAVAVVPTKTMPEGVAAMLAFNAQADLDSNARSMEAAAKHVHTGEVTIATRSVQMNGITVKEGQPIGLVDDGLAALGETVEDVVGKLLDRMHIEDRELVTIYYGDSISAEAAAALASAIRARYDHLELEVVDGGQPHYAYIVSVE